MTKAIFHHALSAQQVLDLYGAGCNLVNLLNYPFGFSGMEYDSEVNGSFGMNYTTEFRAYDTRVGRWWSCDPLFKKFSAWSPYVFSFDNPIFFIDRHGDGPDGEKRAQVAKDVVQKYKENGTTYSNDSREFGLNAKKADCSSFVSTVMAESGQTTLFKHDFTGKGSGGGMQGDIKATSGSEELKDPYRLTNPLAGDIMMWGGHVAIVTEVTSTNVYFAAMGLHGAAIGNVKITDGNVDPANTTGWGSGGFYGFYTPPESTGSESAEAKPCLDLDNATKVIYEQLRNLQQAHQNIQAQMAQATKQVDEYEKQAADALKETEELWKMVEQLDRMMGTHNG